MNLRAFTSKTEGKHREICEVNLKILLNGKSKQATTTLILNQVTRTAHLHQKKAISLLSEIFGRSSTT